MLTIDQKGLRNKEINGVNVTDFREIARFFSKNPRYEGKSIYLIPDNYVKDILGGQAPLTPLPTENEKEGDEQATLVSIITEAKSKSGRKGRKIKKSDINLMRQALEDTMPVEDLEEYISYLGGGIGTLAPLRSEPHAYGKEYVDLKDERKDAIKSVYSKSLKSKKVAVGSGVKGELAPLRQLLFNVLGDPNSNLDWSNEEGEIVPLPITNFTKEQIDDIRLGKTKFYILKSSNPLDQQWKRVTIKGDYSRQLIESGYNNEIVWGSDANPLPNNQQWIEKEDKDCRRHKEGFGEPRFPVHIAYQPTGEEMVEISYIYGPNRSGKTFYAAKYATLWSEMFEDWPIFLFSRRDKDRVLDEIQAVSRVSLTPEGLGLPGNSAGTSMLTMSDFEHSLVIFDDIDTIADKNICKAVQKLRDDIMETGRQKMIYVINTSHLGMNWTPTRTVLNEANSYTLFPRKGNYEHNFNILKSKMGMKPVVIRGIMDRPDGLAHQGKWGWVTVYKDSPQYIIYENGCKLL